MTQAAETVPARSPRAPAPLLASRTAKAAILASGQILTSGASLITFMVLSRVFEQRDYATYRQAFLVFQMASPVLGLGLPAALYYFIPNHPGRTRGVLLENLLVLGCSGFLFSLFLVCGGNRLFAHQFNNPELEKALLVFALYPTLVLPAGSVAACLMSHDKPVQTALFNIGSRLLIVVFVLTAALLTHQVIFALGALAFAAVIALPVALVLMLRSCREGPPKPTVRGAWEQLRYSIPLGLASVMGVLTIRLSHFIVASSASPEEFAVFSNGAMEIPLIAVVTGSVTAVLLPEMTRHYREGRYEMSLDLWRRASVKTAAIIFPAMGLLFIIATDLMVLLYSEKYRASAEPFRILLLLLPIRIVNWAAIFLAAGNSRLVLSRSFSSLIVMLLCAIPMTLMYGHMGAVWALVLVVYVWTVPYCLWTGARLMRSNVKSMLPFRRLSELMFWCILAGLLGWSLNTVLDSQPAWVRLTASSLLYLSVIWPILERREFLSLIAYSKSLRKRLF